MQSITLLILGSMVGFVLKLADDIPDKKLRLNPLFTIPLGIFYGLLMGYMMIVDMDAALIFGGIILGCLVSGKINNTGHYFGLAAVLAIVFSYGLKLSPVVFMIAVFSAFDEMKDIINIPRFDYLFKYRLFMKTGVLLLVGFDFIGLNGLLILFAFDFAYILTERLDSRLIHEV